MYSVVTIPVTISLKSFELCSQEKSLNDQPKKEEDYSRATNNFLILKGHMSDQDSILVGQKENLVGRKHKGTFERVAYKKVKNYL